MKLPPAMLLVALALATAAQEGQEKIPPGPPTYAAIDSVLEEEILLAVGDTWRYFRGVEDPSEELAWTQRGFDDDAWLEGPSPLGWGHADNATKLDGIEPPVTTLYLRTFVSLTEPEEFETIHLEMPVDDGFICWVDGTEADRLHAGWPSAATAFDKTSSWPRTLDLGPLPFVDLTETLQAGDNCIAIQALVHKTSLESLSVRPLLRARYKESAKAEGKRYEKYARRLKAEGAAGRLAYLKGRHLQRTDLTRSVRPVRALRTPRRRRGVSELPGEAKNQSAPLNSLGTAQSPLRLAGPEANLGGNHLSRASGIEAIIGPQGPDRRTGSIFSRSQASWLSSSPNDG